MPRPHAPVLAWLIAEPSFRPSVCAVVAGQRKDGTAVPLTLSVSPCGEPGEYIAVLYRRTDAEARIRAESERRDMSAALQSLSEPVIMMRDRVIVSVNVATLRMFGYEKMDELLGQPVTVLMPPDRAKVHDSYVDRYEQTGETRLIGNPRGAPRPCPARTGLCPKLGPPHAPAWLLVESPFRPSVCTVVTGQRKDGTAVSLTLSVSPCGEPGEYIAILYSRFNVDARKKAESERRDMSAALQSLTELVIMMRDRVIISVNGAALEMFGYDSEDELVGQPVTVLMPPDQATAHDSYVDRYEQTGEKRVIGCPRGARRPYMYRCVDR